MIRKITKLELTNLFSSPVAWLALIGFSIFSAYQLIDYKIHSLAFNQGLYDSEAYMSITSLLLNRGSAYFPWAAKVLMVLIPLVAMGVISRELSTGSIKLIYSSPIKLRSIVLGKYLSILIFLALLMLIVFCFMLTADQMVEHFDGGVALSGCIGLFLLGSLAAAVSVYISTLSSYPVVDVLGTIALLLGLNLLYLQVKNIPVVNEIFYWMSPMQQVSFTFKGLLLSKTAAYFVMLTGFFLLWSYFTMKRKRQTRRGRRVTGIQMTLCLFITCGLIYMLSQPKMQLYKDFTRGKTHQVSEKTKTVLAPLKDKPVRITTYINVLGSPYQFMPEGCLEDKYNALFPYMLELPQIKKDYVYYYDPKDLKQFLRYHKADSIRNIEEALRLQANDFKLNTDQFVKIADLDIEPYRKHRYKSAMRDGRLDNFRVIEAHGKKAVLEVHYNDGYPPFEPQITACFKRLLADRVYTLAVVTGHGERGLDNNSPAGLAAAFSARESRYAFINNGFKVQHISLQSEVPPQVDLLVIADPKTAYTEQEINHFKKYVNSGRDLWILGEPGRGEILNPLTEYVGVRLMPGIVLQDDQRYPPEYIPVELPKEIREKYPQFLVQMPSATSLSLIKDSRYNADYLLTTQAGHASMSLKASVSSEKAVLKPKNEDNHAIIRISAAKPDNTLKIGSSENTVLKSEDGENKTSSSGLNKGLERLVKSENGKNKAGLPLAVYLKSKDKDQKILVTGDTDWLSNERYLHAPPGVWAANGIFVSFLSSLFTDHAYPVDIAAKPAQDLRVKIAYANIKYIKGLWYGLIPLLFALVGGVRLIRRMRK